VTPPSATELAEPPVGSSPPAAVALQSGGSGGRGDEFFRGVALIAGLAVLGILALITWSTTKQAWPAFRAEGLRFVTSDQWDPIAGKFGAKAFIYGTLLSSLIALIIAVPVSVGIALFTTETAPRRLKKPVVYVIDLLAAVPSVVYGLWGVLVLAPNIQPVYQAIANATDGIPVLGSIFGGQASGRSFMTAGIILAIMIVPIVTSLSREVIATVPGSQREAAYGMGATRWEMIRYSVLPWSRGGITGAVMLGLGRAMGETIAVALVIGSNAQITSHVFLPGDSMAAVIANQFGEAGSLHKSALIGLGVVLFAITILVNVAARSIVTRLDRRTQGA
jgi:phosphate transport system permease protein